MVGTIVTFLRIWLYRQRCFRKYSDNYDIGKKGDVVQGCLPKVNTHIYTLNSSSPFSRVISGAY